MAWRADEGRSVKGDRQRDDQAASETAQEEEADYDDQNRGNHRRFRRLWIIARCVRSCREPCESQCPPATGVASPRRSCTALMTLTVLAPDCFCTINAMAGARETRPHPRFRVGVRHIGHVAQPHQRIPWRPLLLRQSRVVSDRPATRIWYSPLRLDRAGGKVPVSVIGRSGPVGPTGDKPPAPAGQVHIDLPFLRQCTRPRRPGDAP